MASFTILLLRLIIICCSIKSQSASCHVQDISLNKTTADIDRLLYWYSNIRDKVISKMFSVRGIPYSNKKVLGGVLSDRHSDWQARLKVKDQHCYDKRLFGFVTKRPYRKLSF